MGFLEHSKKAGRISALVICLAILGTLSVMKALNDPASTNEIMDDWFKVLSIIVTFYFVSKQEGE